MPTKKKLLFLLIIIIISMFFYTLFVPQRFFDYSASFPIDVYYVQEIKPGLEESGTNITKEIDLEQLSLYLFMMEGYRLPHSIKSYSLSDNKVRYMFSVMYNYNTYDIILSDSKFNYICTPYGDFKIKDSRFWLEILDNLSHN